MAQSTAVGTAVRHDHEASKAVPNKPSTPTRPSPLALATTDPSTASAIPSPPADASSGDEDPLYGEDDAQSLIQPAMSAVATRMVSPKTPVAEKVAAMDQTLDGYFDAGHASNDGESSGEETPKQLPSPREPPSSAIPPSQPEPEPLERLPTPWKPGPKQIVVASSKAPAHKSAMTSVLSTARHRRSSSGGTDAFKRLSRALPSLSLPANFMNNHRLSTPNFFSSSHTVTSPKPESPETTPPKGSPTSQSPPNNPQHAVTFPAVAPPTSPPPPRRPSLANSSQLVRLPSTVSRKSLALRRSASHDSMLYHSLSRMSSFGDDHRFTHIREQVNSRFKAIVDSFDTPSFKLPSMPSMPSTLSLRSPLKKSEFTVEETRHGPARSDTARAIKGPMDPLDSVLENLTGDLVILGGYRGSVLRSAEPPHRQLWVPMKVGLNVRKVNLEVGLNPEDEERMEESIIPSGMLKNIGPIDISRRLFKRIRDCENARTGKLRVHDYGYDWRLSPHLLSKKLVEFLQTLPSNQGQTPTGALVVAHSLGGIITRHAVNQAPQLFSGVVYAGSPQRAINILGPLRNGDAVLLNEKVLTAHVNFTLRTTFVFLPEDGFCFVDKVTNEEYPIDFYKAEEWTKHRLCPSVSDAALAPFAPLTAAKRIGSLGSLLSLPDSLTRGRSSSDPAARRPGQSPHRNKITKDRTLAPQMDASSSATTDKPATRSNSPRKRARKDADRERNLDYLARALADTKRFRAELQHQPSLQSANAYPPVAVIYGKEIPTVYAARVSCREAIACTDAYDDLVFRSGDGVVLAREAMPPPGYEIAKGGRISTDKGHISLLGDMNAVGRALGSVVRGRDKGIGLGGVVSKG